MLCLLIVSVDQNCKIIVLYMYLAFLFLVVGVHTINIEYSHVFRLLLSANVLLNNMVICLHSISWTGVKLYFA